MNYTPLNDYVIVQQVAASNTTASGIILQSSTAANNAKVLAVAADVPVVKVGDIVMLRWSNALKIDGDLYAVSAKEIVTIIS